MSLAILDVTLRQRLPDELWALIFEMLPVSMGLASLKASLIFHPINVETYYSCTSYTVENREYEFSYDDNRDYPHMYRVFYGEFCVFKQIWASIDNNDGMSRYIREEYFCTNLQRWNEFKISDNEYMYMLKDSLD